MHNFLMINFQNSKDYILLRTIAFEICLNNKLVLQSMMKATNIVVVTTLIIAAFALISMPQMIGSANAQSKEASEHACPVPGYTLSKGECTAEPTTKFICEPSTVGGVEAILFESEFVTLCEARSTTDELKREDCTDISEDATYDVKKPDVAVCRFPPTETITCPGGVPPTEEGECITKPGRGNDPRT
jgi:hypothetical protein